jgi:enamine deaminase RidA (YjgF/YER057c/UK114 family)
MRAQTAISICVSVGLCIVTVVTVSPVQAEQGAEAALKTKNIELPPPGRPVGNYVEHVRVGNLLFIAGHGPTEKWRGKGKVGKDLTVDQGYQAARDACLRILATTREAIGSLDKIKRVVKIFGMVNSGPGFGEQPKVINGCSDLLTEVFGEANGRGARSAVGMAELPFGIPVEVEMIFELVD